LENSQRNVDQKKGKEVARRGGVSKNKREARERRTKSLPTIDGKKRLSTS